MKMRHLTVALLIPFVALACGRKAAEAPKAEAPKPEAERADEHGTMPEEVKLTPAAITEAGIDTWKVEPVNLEHLLTLNGTVAYDENRLLQVAAHVKGRVAAILVDLGARVAKEAPLLVLESMELGKVREELVKALTDLRVAVRAYDRAKRLVDGKAISTGEFQSREGDYLLKKATAESAERALRLVGEPDEEIARIRSTVESGSPVAFPDGPRLTIRAPFGGRVIERKATQGSLVEALQPLLTLADLSSTWVFLQAYEKDLAVLRVGLPVTLRSEAYAQESFKGRIDFLGSVVDAATRTVRLRATVANHHEKLRPGMFVKAQLDIPQTYEEGKVVAVPQSALQSLEGRTHVFVQKEPGVFVRRAVEVGHTFEGFTEIYSGVKGGDVVVTEGSFVLKSEFAKATLAEEH